MVGLDVIRILLVDDHLLFRQAVRDVLALEQDLVVVAEASDGQEAALLAAEVQPDVVLLSLSMPVCHSCETIERILACAPHACVVIFASSNQAEHILCALQCGAIGYITKDTDPESLLMALRRAARHEFYLTPTLAAHFLTFVRTLTLHSEQTQQSAQSDPSHHLRQQSKSKRHQPLSCREQEVLALIRLGQRNREIARTLHISEATVHKHIQHIFAKLHARNRAEALFLAQV